MGERRYFPPKPEIGPTFPGEPKFNILLLNANPYRLGIANLGWQAVTEYLLKNKPHVLVRVEYADTLRNGKIHWKDFDLIALTIPFETVQPNALRMLSQIGLPLLKEKREDSMPLVVAGGGGVHNPFPLIDFIDVFIFGDGRKPLREIVTLACSGMKKREILESCSQYRNMGIFVPEFGGKVLACPELPLNEYPIHTIWSSKDNPYGLGADYLSIMVGLGCNRYCPFCVVSHCQGLGRDREITPQKILEILERRRKFIHVKTVKLFFSSSISVENLKEILRELKREGVEVLVGSLNCSQIDEELLQLLKEAGPNRVIVAPETTEKQRWKVNKGYISDERLFEIVKLCNLYSLELTLYLMYGLPGEEKEDVIELGKLVREIRRRLNENIKVDINPLFMKPHTPFEFAEQISLKESAERFSLFKEQVGKIKIQTEDPDSALLQIIVSRGDRRVGELLKILAFNPPHSLVQAIEKILPNWREYFKERDLSSIPWRDIVFKFSHEQLWQRWQALKKSIRSFN